MIYARKKINKMPKFYMIFARKIFFPIFFWGEGGNCSPDPRLLCIWFKQSTVTSLFTLGYEACNQTSKLQPRNLRMNSA